MNIPKVKYVKSKKKIPDIDVIFEAIEKFTEEYTKNRKYIEVLIIKFLSIPILKKILYKCKKIFKKKKLKKEDYIEIGKILYPYSMNSFGTKVGMVTIMQRSGQLKLLSENINKELNKHKLSIENWNESLKAIKSAMESGNAKDPNLKLIDELIPIQNEIFEVAGIKPSDEKRLVTQFAEGLKEFVITAPIIGENLNSDDGYLELCEDIAKLMQGKFEIPDSSEEDIEDIEDKISTEMLPIENQLAEINNKVNIASQKASKKNKIKLNTKKHFKINIFKSKNKKADVQNYEKDLNKRISITEKAINTFGDSQTAKSLGKKLRSLMNSYNKAKINISKNVKRKK